MLHCGQTESGHVNKKLQNSIFEISVGLKPIFLKPKQAQALSFQTQTSSSFLKIWNLKLKLATANSSFYQASSEGVKLGQFKLFQAWFADIGFLAQQESKEIKLRKENCHKITDNP